MKHVKLFESFVNEGEKLPTVEELIELFTKVNADSKENGEEEEIPLTDVDYYSGQIENLYFGGELDPCKDAVRLAKEMADKVGKTNESEELNENVAIDILQQAMSLLTDKTVVNVAGDMMTRGEVVQYALGIFIGMPLSALILTNKKEILEALKKKYKNFMEFFKDIKDAKKDQEIA